VAQECAFLARSFRAVRDLDVFVISGGGQLLDSWGGPWAYPYTIFKWVMLTSMVGMKCYFVNVGAGPLKHPLSRFFVRHALAMADYVSFRDETSKALARSIGFTGEADVFPDCVYAIDAEAWRTECHAGANAKVVGLSPMAWCDPRRYWQRDQDAYEMFVQKIASFGADLARSYRITLFSTDVWFDSQTLQAVDERLKAATGDQVTRMSGSGSIHSLDTLLSEMAAMDYVITCRFHGVIFAHLMNIPVIALSHHTKVTTLMADLGLSEYCLNIDDFDVDQLSVAFARMVANTAEIKARMAEKVAYYESALARQFESLFQPELA
jgi:polysaccharide pyruvyl transferase WcaK-like protein